MKHTPGPWEVLNNYVKKVGGGVIATTSRNGSICRFEEDVGSLHDAANARLIAAAPELLEALKDARQQLIALCSENDVPDSVNLAIAKAEGK